MNRIERFYKNDQSTEERRAEPIAMRVDPVGVSRAGLVVAGEFDPEVG